MSLSRILLSINVRWWNAEAAYAINLARGLAEQGIDPWLIVNPGSPVHKKAKEYGLQTITDILLDSGSPVVQYQNLKKILLQVDRHNIELINSFKSNGAFLFTLVKRLRPGITYVKTRGIASPPKNHFINRYLYGSRSCHGVIAVGSSVQRWISMLLKGNGDQPVQTIYYGDTTVSERGLEKHHDTEPAFTFPQGKKVFALLGRTQGVKGHLLLLEALRSLKHEKIHILFLVKDLNEFPDVMEEIHGFLATHRLKDRVTILGFQEKLGRVLTQVHCGVIPSLASEVNCRACVEFFSMGIPVIAFPTGTLPDIISHFENGFLCNEKTVSQLNEGIKWALAEESKFSLVKQRALADYRHRYTLKKMASETLRFYHQCKSV